MTENNDQIGAGETEVKPDELSLLKERADVMGITYHPNIGLEKLKEKVTAKLNPPVIDSETTIDPEYLDEELDTIETADRIAGLKSFAPLAVETPQMRLNKKKKDALRLVRVRVTNMNPIKANMTGEIFSVGNAAIGFVKKYVPFNADQGWHVPQILVTALREKKYMAHYTVKAPGTNRPINKNKLVHEYAIEILPPLTGKELEALRQRQIIAGSGSSQD